MTNSIYRIDSVFNSATLDDCLPPSYIQKINQCREGVKDVNGQLDTQIDLSKLDANTTNTREIKVHSHVKREVDKAINSRLIICLEGRALASLSGQNEEIRPGQALLISNLERPLHFYAHKASLLEIEIRANRYKQTA